jgi:hypothetical protein
MSRATAVATAAVGFFLIVAAAASASLPTITYSIEGIAGSNGWYRGSAYGDNVVLHWSVANGDAPACPAAVEIPGPTTGTTRSCTAKDPISGSSVTVVTAPIKIDATPPTVTVSLSRKPDFNGWYNHPVTIRWSGADATSGIGSCTSGTYRGPDNAAARVNGGCIDRAGNSTGRAVQLAYDATPPVLTKVAEESTAGANVLRWSSSSPADRVVVRRSIRGSKARTTVFDGSAAEFTDQKIRPGAEYRYSVQSFDQAGNSSKVVDVAGLPKVLTLQKRSYVPRVAPHPILRWGRFRGAGYYNVQLFRGSKRIYSAWPTAHQVGLPTTWKWSRHRFRLTPGRYRWYVWAGLGARTLARYHTVGSASFVVPRR